MSNILGSRLEKLRKENQLSQQELAEKLNVSRLSIGNYERGNRIPNSDFLIEVSKIFDCSVDYLLGLSKYRSVHEKNTVDNQIANLVELFDSLTPDEVICMILSLEGIIENSQHIDNDITRHKYIDITIALMMEFRVIGYPMSSAFESSNFYKDQYHVSSSIDWMRHSIEELRELLDSFLKEKYKDIPEIKQLINSNNDK